VPSAFLAVDSPAWTVAPGSDALVQAPCDPRAVSPNVEAQVLSGGLPVLRFGTGAPLVVLAGATPVHANPTGLARRATLLPYRALARDRRVWLVNRRPGLAPDATVADLAADHADALASAFGAPVDVLGVSTGGSIALQLAADRPDTVRRLVVVGAAHRVGDLGREVLVRVADLHEQGDSRGAYREFARASTTSKIGQRVLGGLQRLTEPLVFGRHIDRSDWVATLRAEARFDLGPRLSEITAPTLVIGGGRDLAYPAALFRATADGVEDGRLALYAGRGHGGTIADRRFPRDTLAHLD
jgi:pimeloyl-ACP methyl ester carboxylesterase